LFTWPAAVAFASQGQPGKNARGSSMVPCRRVASGGKGEPLFGEERDS
jgi:hypothetical protein